MRTLLVIALLFFAGCIPATQQEVLNLTNTVNQIVPLVREMVATSSKDTKDKIEIVLGQVEEINEAVATAEIPIEAVKTIVAATSSVNPYAVPILVGISILEALGIFGMNKLRENNHTALEEVVIGIEDWKKKGGNQNDSLKNLNEAFNATESIVTRRKVAKIVTENNIA